MVENVEEDPCSYLLVPVLDLNSPHLDHRYNKKLCGKTKFQVFSDEECAELIKISENSLLKEDSSGNSSGSRPGYKRALLNTGKIDAETGQKIQVLDEVRTGCRCLMDVSVAIERRIFSQIRNVIVKHGYERMVASRDKAWKYALTYGSKKIAHWVLEGIALSKEKEEAEVGAKEAKEEEQRTATAQEKESAQKCPTVWRLAGLNPRFRLLRYCAGECEQFGPHFDGTYDGNFRMDEEGFWVKVVAAKNKESGAGEQKNEANALGSESCVLQRSFFTVIIYLTSHLPPPSDCFEDGSCRRVGMGETNFLTETNNDGDSEENTNHEEKPPLIVGTCHPEAGKALIFEHDMRHEGAVLQAGGHGKAKYVLRTDVMYVRDMDWEKYEELMGDRLDRNDEKSEHDLENSLSLWRCPVRWPDVIE
eukprot:TRINITY_DN9441_c2_g1_i1.p1 TRINITY_DN9441_c2_g1~~TRINITY_DN9441_c2_g1_i1.p1  ORF type:complete len:420 (+),score=56.22 TRINITY_DN9441_c2_g1_i1:72-1331(+)